jgi:BirA family biotin operon repressor/biotin-[acetyl-CoA-carboxylase] ligase
VKWPNDVWIGGRKVAGILCEAAGEDRPVVAGIGVNLREVPDDLPDDVREGVTCLDREAGRLRTRGDLLAALLPRVDARLDDLASGPRRAALEGAWRGRLALRARRIRFVLGGESREGVFRDASWGEGLLVEAQDGRLERHRAEHVREVRPAPVDAGKRP